MIRDQKLKKVIQAIKTNGVGQTYRAVMNRLDMPSPFGYSCAGEIICVGEQVRQFHVGDWARWAVWGYSKLERSKSIGLLDAVLSVRFPVQIGDSNDLNLFDSEFDK